MSDYLDKPGLLNHRNPSADLTVALDRNPQCMCLHCTARRERDARDRMSQAAREAEKAVA